VRPAGTRVTVAHASRAVYIIETIIYRAHRGPSKTGTMNDDVASSCAVYRSRGVSASNTSASQ
jgi:hypothetical protein